MHSNRRRTHRIEVALNDKEYDKFKQNVQLYNMTQQKYLHNLITRHEPKPLPAQDFFTMIEQLRRIGNNLNQLVMIAHKTGSIDIVRYKRDIVELNKNILEIREKVLLPEENSDGDD